MALTSENYYVPFSFLEDFVNYCRSQKAPWLLSRDPLKQLFLRSIDSSHLKAAPGTISEQDEYLPICMIEEKLECKNERIFLPMKSSYVNTNFQRFLNPVLYEKLNQHAESCNVDCFIQHLEFMTDIDDKDRGKFVLYFIEVGEKYENS